jgi:hypothetical protein
MKGQFKRTLKPAGRYGLLLNEFQEEVTIEFQRCDICDKEFIGTYHNDDAQNPIQLAITVCENC